MATFERNTSNLRLCGRTRNPPYSASNEWQREAWPAIHCKGCKLEGFNLPQTTNDTRDGLQPSLRLSPNIQPATAGISRLLPSSDLLTPVSSLATGGCPSHPRIRFRRCVQVCFWVSKQCMHTSAIVLCAEIIKCE